MTGRRMISCHNGHMNDVVRAAIRYGMEPVAAIKSATLNNAREAGIENLGQSAPGYAADLQIVESLTELKPSKVFYGGKLVAENGSFWLISKKSLILWKAGILYT